MSHPSSRRRLTEGTDDFASSLATRKISRFRSIDSVKAVPSVSVSVSRLFVCFRLLGSSIPPFRSKFTKSVSGLHTTNSCERFDLNRLYCTFLSFSSLSFQFFLEDGLFEMLSLAKERKDLSRLINPFEKRNTRFLPLSSHLASGCRHL